MRRAAKTKAVSEQPRPILAGPQVALRKPRAPQVFCAFLTVSIMRIAPEPGRQHLVLVRLRCHANGAPILFSLRGEEPFKRRTRQLTWIPRSVRPNLRITHIRSHASN